MKRYNRVLISIGIVFLLCLLACGALLSKVRTKPVDMILLNDVAKTVEENFDALQSIDADSFGVDFLVINSDGKVIFSTCSTSIDSMSAVIAGNLTHLSVTQGDRYLGEVVFLEEQANQYAGVKLGVLFSILLAFAVAVFVMAMYGRFVNKTIIKPFENMQEFANEIAVGNLDIELARDQDNMFGAFSESFDIMREELATSKAREIELKKREKEMIAQLSHDLKTPITGIKITSELLKVKVQDEYELEKISNIYEKAEQIDTLVSDLFASTLDELGQIQVSCRDEEAGILADIVKRHDDRELINQGAVPDCIILIDARRVEQIVSNCISNSYKYANTKIDVDYSIIKGYLQMVIRDYGPGIDENELPLVTGKYYRGKSEEVSMQPGSGLGLYISKNLIERMEGEIICSNSNPGFCVKLLIPLS